MGVEMREFLPGERICGQCGELGREQCCGETCDESAACPICGETYWKGSDKCLTEAAERIILANAERDAARKRVDVLTQALRRAHACATLRADGTCDGCYVSDALQPVEPGGGDSGKGE